MELLKVTRSPIHYSFANLANFLLIVGILTLSAMKVRLADTPITLSVLILLLFSVVSCSSGIRLRPLHFLFLKWFAVLGICLLVGMSLNYINFHSVNSSSWHDLFSYVFSVLLIFSLGNDALDIDRCMRISAMILPVVYFIFCFYTWGYDLNDRFFAMAMNANQFALGLSVVPFICLYFFKSAGRWEKIGLASSILISIYLGYKTRTHALLVAWLLAFLFAALKSFYPRKRVFWVLVFFTVVIFLGAFFFWIKNYSEGEPQVRLQLWQAGLSLLAQSPWVGYGPGSFITTHTTLGYVTHYEAHNTFLDLALQGGLIGLAAYLWFLYQVGRCSIGKSTRLMTFAVLLVFSCFHFILRQPIVWLSFYWLCHREESRSTHTLIPRHS